MAAVSEIIVREYFEALGFMVQQPCKYQVVARKKRVNEEIDLLVFNPKITEQSISKNIIWAADEFKNVARAIVSVRGWHTETISPSVLAAEKGMFRFTRESVVKNSSKILGDGPVAKVICLPRLPVSKSLREQTLSSLKEHDIDGVLLFRTMLLELFDYVDKKKSYDKSYLLQVIRILKIHDLLKEPQMELFVKQSRRKRNPKNLFDGKKS